MQSSTAVATRFAPTCEYDPVKRLILELARLPGVGERSATRLAYYIIQTSQHATSRQLVPLTHDLAQALLDVEEHVRLCETCHDICSQAVCVLCTDARRDSTLLCVVASPQDVRALENSRAHRGLYHVLHGLLSPIDGKDPDALRLFDLPTRIVRNQVREVVVATPSTVEGDATALYIQRLLQASLLEYACEESPLRLSRLASGLPVGGELEYLDSGTLERAMRNRVSF